MIDRALPFALAFLLAAPLVAHAEDVPSPIGTAPMTAAPGGDVCKAIEALPDGPTDATCKKGASKKIKGVGTAAVYTLKSADGWTRYDLAITGADGSTQLSPPMDFLEDCAMGGKCEVVKKLTPKLRAITVGGVAAASLDVDAKMSHELTSMDTGKHVSSTPFKRHVYVACGVNGAGAWSCATADFGGYEAPCTSKLSNDGQLTYACETTESLVF